MVVAGGVVSALAFPRIGPGWLILPGVALFLTGLRMTAGRGQGLLFGGLYGLTFFSPAMVLGGLAGLSFYYLVRSAREGAI